MTIIDLYNDERWKVLPYLSSVDKPSIRYRILGSLITRYDLDHIKNKMVRYIRVREEDTPLGSYLCGLYSTLLRRRIDMMIGDDYAFAETDSDMYLRGKRGDRFGKAGLDSYLHAMQKKVKAINGAV